MKKKSSPYNVFRIILIFWTLFIGIGAVAGGVSMILDPSGKLLHMDAMLPFFRKLPFSDILFRDFPFSGFALLIVNGLTNLTAAVLILQKKKLGVILGGIFGITLMLWICIQFYMFPLNFMSTAFFIFGFCQAVCCLILFAMIRKKRAAVFQPFVYTTSHIDHICIAICIVYDSPLIYTVSGIAHRSAFAFC